MTGFLDRGDYCYSLMVVLRARVCGGVGGRVCVCECVGGWEGVCVYGCVYMCVRACARVCVCVGWRVCVCMGVCICAVSYTHLRAH